MAEMAAATSEVTIPENLGKGFPDTLVDQMVEAGVHFGHRSSRWNPKMKAFIKAKKNLIHIIDLRQTVKGLIKAAHILENIAKNGGEILIVGTKWQARHIVRQVAEQAGVHFVVDRWLGGTLTNHTTIRSRLRRLEELEAMETSGAMDQLPKKMSVRLRREKEKVFSNLEGIRHMDKLPQAVLVVDARKEIVALKEATRLGIPTLAIIDTDSDPDWVDIAIPANDDAHRSVELLLATLGQAIQRGREAFKATQALRAKGEVQRPRGGGRDGQTQPAQSAQPASQPPAQPVQKPKRLEKRIISTPSQPESGMGAPAPTSAGNTETSTDTASVS